VVSRLGSGRVRDIHHSDAVGNEQVESEFTFSCVWLFQVFDRSRFSCLGRLCYGREQEFAQNRHHADDPLSIKEMS
jgi:hypothetical protein